MATFGDDEGKKKKLKSKSKACNPDVDSCTSGEKSVHTRSNMKQRAFSTTKSRYNLPKGTKKKVEPVVEKTASMHMNVRDLGGSPGDPTYNVGSDRNVNERKKAEITLTKNRKFFKKKQAY